MREADTEHGHFTARHGFEVIVSTHLQRDDFRELLERALPLDRMQPIMPTVKPRATNAGGAESGGEGAGSKEVLFDEEYKAWTTLEEAQAAAVKLRERVEAARERRARGLTAGDDACCGGFGGRGSGSGSRSSGSGGSVAGSMGDREPSSDAVVPGGAGATDNGVERGCRADWHPSNVVVTQPELAGIYNAEEMPPPVTRCYASKRDLEMTARAQKSMDEHRRFTDSLAWKAFSHLDLGASRASSG